MKYENDLNLIRARFIQRRQVRLDAESETSEERAEPERNAPKKANGANTRLPYGLCKKYGIEIKKGWLPSDCWKALKKGYGIDPDEEYDKFQEEQEKEQSKNNSSSSGTEDKTGEEKKPDENEKPDNSANTNSETNENNKPDDTETSSNSNNTSSETSKKSHKKKSSTPKVTREGGKNKISFGKSAYSQSKKDKAFWIDVRHNWYDGGEEEVYDFVKGHAKKLAKNLSDSEVEPIECYTGAWYDDINRGIVYGKDIDNVRGMIDSMTNTFKDNTFSCDVWVESKMHTEKFKAIFGKEVNEIKVGDEGFNCAFMSTSLGKTDVFDSRPIYLNIYCPKGTEGMYVEDVTTITDENEFILQRGSKFKVTKIENGGNKWYIDVDLVSQEYEEPFE